MKRYVVFAYDTYYPVGGWNDFKGAYETMKEALKTSKNLSDYDTVEIVDMITLESTEVLYTDIYKRGRR